MDNPIQKWIENDGKVLTVIENISRLNLTVEEQAEMAFHRLCDLYNLPKIPEDANKIAELTGETINSVYQELGLVKFLEPDEDIRGLVMVAVFNVLNKATIKLEDVYKKAGMSAERPICFSGEFSRVKISFVDETTNWFDNGCKLYLKSNS